jgi:hypothetical protein
MKTTTMITLTSLHSNKSIWKLTDKIFHIVDVKILRVVNEEIDLVFGIIEGSSPREELLQEGGRLLDEDGDDEVRDFLQVVEQYVLLPAVGTLEISFD